MGLRGGRSGPGWEARGRVGPPEARDGGLGGTGWEEGASARLQLFLILEDHLEEDLAREALREARKAGGETRPHDPLRFHLGLDQVTYTVEFAPAFARDFRRLPRADLVRVDGVIQALREEPRPPGARAIRGFPSGYRLRIGQYRLVYEVRDRTLVALLLALGHRREIHERLKRRRDPGES